MNLVWKLLRQHISIPQFMGFFFANLFGMLIILLGIQFYSDTQAIYNGEDSFMKADFLIVNKKVGAVSSLTGKSNAFTKGEIEDFKDQDFVEELGYFTPSSFNVHASFNIEQMANISTDMFFESVPDEFVDVASDEWKYTEGSTQIPIILPKNYLDLYNFGYAQSRNMPKLSEGILAAMKLKVWVDTADGRKEFEGKIAGFSSRLNTILVPESFMVKANEVFAPGKAVEPTRLIVKVKNPADEDIASYLQDNGYETDKDKLDASKTSFLLRIVVSVVMGIGFVICVLSFYILMLSIYLLVQKNSSKLENLLLIGYSPTKVSLPYQILTVGLNGLVLVLSFGLLFVARSLYLALYENFFPDMVVPGMAISIVIGIILFFIVSILNIIAVRRKVMTIWNRKD